MADTPRLHHDDLVVDTPSRPRDVVGDEGGSTLVGSTNRDSVDGPDSPPPVTPGAAEGERDRDDQSR